MSFINKVISPDEKLVGVCTAHWIYAVMGIFWMAGFMLVGLKAGETPPPFFAQLSQNEYLYTYPALGYVFMIVSNPFLICTIIGVTLFLVHLIIMITTEIGLTNKRLIFKRGLIFVDVKEVDLEEIKAMDVNNGWFGRIFNYGYLKLDARFVNNIFIPAIGDPYRFLKAANEIRSDIKQDSMTVVVEGHAPVTKPEEVGAAPAAAPPVKTPEPARQLDDPRYAALEAGVAKAAHEIKQETQENIEKPIRGPDGEAPMKQTAAPPPVAQKTPAPIIFEKNALKEELKEEIIEDFSGALQKPA